MTDNPRDRSPDEPPVYGEKEEEKEGKEEKKEKDREESDETRDTPGGGGGGGSGGDRPNWQDEADYNMPRDEPPW